jgi:phosphatidylethanolamine-binding protein (PEBP) family uncharacterized protein
MEVRKSAVSSILALTAGSHSRSNPILSPTVEITGRVYEPQAISPTDERVQRFGYIGPRPPAGDPPHRYDFQLFALDTTLELASGFNRHALLEAMEGHVLAKSMLVGTFAREP